MASMAMLRRLQEEGGEGGPSVGIQVVIVLMIIALVFGMGFWWFRSVQMSKRANREYKEKMQAAREAHAEQGLEMGNAAIK